MARARGQMGISSPASRKAAARIVAASPGVAAVTPVTVLELRRWKQSGVVSVSRFLRATVASAPARAGVSARVRVRTTERGGEAPDGPERRRQGVVDRGHAHVPQELLHLLQGRVDLGHEDLVDAGQAVERAPLLDAVKVAEGLRPVAELVLGHKVVHQPRVARRVVAPVDQLPRAVQVNKTKTKFKTKRGRGRARRRANSARLRAQRKRARQG